MLHCPGAGRGLADRNAVPAAVFPQPQYHRAAVEVCEKKGPVLDLLCELQRLQASYLHVPGADANQL